MKLYCNYIINYKIFPPPNLVKYFQANWARSAQYCRYHGLHLASVTSAAEQRLLEKHIETIGLGNEHFWTSGTDQGEEGKFVWMSTGKPLGFENWNAGEPNNYE